jgi:hypothetical protein
MWKVVTTQQGEPLSSSSHLFISEARVNIPALSARSIQRDIEKSGFTGDAHIQVAINSFVAIKQGIIDCIRIVF